MNSNLQRNTDLDPQDPSAALQFIHEKLRVGKLDEIRPSELVLLDSISAIERFNIYKTYPQLLLDSDTNSICFEYLFERVPDPSERMRLYPYLRFTILFPTLASFLSISRIERSALQRISITDLPVIAQAFEQTGVELDGDEIIFPDEFFEDPRLTSLLNNGRRRFLEQFSNDRQHPSLRLNPPSYSYDVRYNRDSTDHLYDSSTLLDLMSFISRYNLIRSNGIIIDSQQLESLDDVLANGAADLSERLNSVVRICVTPPVGSIDEKHTDGMYQLEKFFYLSSQYFKNPVFSFEGWESVTADLLEVNYDNLSDHYDNLSDHRFDFRGTNLNLYLYKSGYRDVFIQDAMNSSRLCLDVDDLQHYRTIETLLTHQDLHLRVDMETDLNAIPETISKRLNELVTYGHVVQLDDLSPFMRFPNLSELHIKLESPSDLDIILDSNFTDSFLELCRNNTGIKRVDFEVEPEYETDEYRGEITEANSVVNSLNSNPKKPSTVVFSIELPSDFRVES